MFIMNYYEKHHTKSALFWTDYTQYNLYAMYLMEIHMCFKIGLLQRNIVVYTIKMCLYIKTRILIQMQNCTHDHQCKQVQLLYEIAVETLWPTCHFIYTIVLAVKYEMNQYTLARLDSIFLMNNHLSIVDTSKLFLSE